MLGGPPPPPHALNLVSDCASGVGQRKGPYHLDRDLDARRPSTLDEG